MTGRIASDAVAILRAEAGRDPYDKLLSHLIGELSTRSDEFRVRWGAHNVKFHRTGAKTLHHPVVGDLTLDYEALDLPGDTGQRILVYSAEPGSPSQQALDLLAVRRRHRRDHAQTRPPTSAERGGEQWESSQGSRRARARPSGSPVASGSTASSSRTTTRSSTSAQCTSPPVPHRLALPRGRPDPLRHRMQRPRAVTGREDRGDPPRRHSRHPGRPGPLAWRRPRPLHDPHLHHPGSGHLG